MEEIKTIRETAAEMGVYATTVSDLITKLGLTPKRLPLNGNAKGLDRKDRAIIRERLRPLPARRPVAATM